MPARRKALAGPVKIKLKKNDIVKVIAGRDKGKQGRVIEIDRRVRHDASPRTALFARNLRRFAPDQPTSQPEACRLGRAVKNRWCERRCAPRRRIWARPFARPPLSFPAGRR